MVWEALKSESPRPSLGEKTAILKKPKLIRGSLWWFEALRADNKSWMMLSY
jgi:hypothetical protein